MATSRPYLSFRSIKMKQLSIVFALIVASCATDVYAQSRWHQRPTRNPRFARRSRLRRPAPPRPMETAIEGSMEELIEGGAEVFTKQAIALATAGRILGWFVPESTSDQTEPSRKKTSLSPSKTTPSPGRTTPSPHKTTPAPRITTSYP